MAIDRRRLRIHLNDHLAALTGGIAAAERCRANNTEGPLAEPLSSFVADLRDDEAHLRRVMGRLRLPGNAVKSLAAGAAERAGRLKLNGQLTGYSPLSRLLELEGLCVTTELQRLLWTGLREVAPHEPALAALPLADLVTRAERWHADLDRHRREAVGRALTG